MTTSSEQTLRAACDLLSRCVQAAHQAEFIGCADKEVTAVGNLMLAAQAVLAALADAQPPTIQDLGVIEFADGMDDEPADAQPEVEREPDARQIIDTLDEIARDVDRFEFGLPVFTEMERMVEAITPLLYRGRAPLADAQPEVERKPWWEQEEAERIAKRLERSVVEDVAMNGWTVLPVEVARDIVRLLRGRAPSGREPPTFDELWGIGRDHRPDATSVDLVREMREDWEAEHE